MTSRFRQKLRRRAIRPPCRAAASKPGGSARRRVARAVPVATLLVCGCVSTGQHRYPAPAPVFDPITFFAGATEGTGSLKVVFTPRQSTLVEGHGTVAGRTVVLDQTVRRGDRAPTQRRWVLQETAPGRYAGTLTDASGPVTGDVTGNELHLAFPMKGGLRAEQWLYLEAGGERARNRMVVSKFGLPVASLDETIRRLPDPPRRP